MALAPITGTKIQDAAGNLLALGQITFTPTDGNGTPIPAHSNAGGFITTAPAVATITNGTIQSGFQVAASPDVSPLNLNYTVTITDAVSGDELLVLPGVTVPEVGIDFDTFDPSALLPTIPSAPVFAQVNSDWNASSGVAQILNKPVIPTIPVTSVAGKTGAVALVESDIANLVTDLAAKAAKGANTDITSLTGLTGVIKINGDTGLSRTAAGTVAVGNGSAGDYTGTLKLAAIASASGTVISSESWSGGDIATFNPNPSQVGPWGVSINGAGSGVNSGGDIYLRLKEIAIVGSTAGVSRGLRVMSTVGGTELARFDLAGVTAPKLQATITDPANPGVIIKAAASQTADLQQWQNSTGTPLAKVTSAGVMTTTGMSVVSAGQTNFAVYGDGSFTAAANSNTNPFVVDSNSNLTCGGSAEIQGDLTVDGNLSSGDIYANALYLTGGVTCTGLIASSPLMVPTAASNQALTVRGAVSQSADLQQWQTSTGSPLTKIDPNGNLSMVAGTATVGKGVPVIVAKVSLTGQTAAIGVTNLYTPSAAGTYRVSMCITLQVRGTAGQILPYIGFNNGYLTSTAYYFLPTALNSTDALGTSWGGVTTIHSTSGSPISYQVYFSGVTGSPQYGIDVVVEQLQ